MRYYHFSLGISAQAIRENEELGRHWNLYEETLEVINEYMTKNLRNHLSFLAYREEEKSIPAVFTYDEKKLSYQEAYQFILDDNEFDFRQYSKIWERLLLTNGIERAQFAAKTPATETILFMEYIKEF